MPGAQAAAIARRFALPEPVRVAAFPERGNINQHTYLVTAGPPGSARDYILQCVNGRVFTRPDRVMDSMVAAIHAQMDYLALSPLPEGDDWEPVELVPTRDGAPYLQVQRGDETDCWRVMVRILGCETFKSLGQIADPVRRLGVAEETGRGLALWGDLTSAMDPEGLADPLPGYRNTQLYYAQLVSVLEGSRTQDEATRWLPQDPVVLHSTGRHFLVHVPEDEYRRRKDDPGLARFVDLALDRQEFALALHRDMERGQIRTVAIHGDTKIDNFLFDARTRRVRSLVDLDTIMPQTWLVDWGDMVRSLCNVAGEKETDLGRVQADMEMYRALARGFLGTARNVQPAEVGRMVDAVETIALELGIRFLADYIRGDSYFVVGPGDPPDLNRTRAMVQLTLFERLRERRTEAESCIAELSAEGGGAARRRARRVPRGEKRMRQLKIGTSWVRGVVGDALTPELVVNFACAFGTWCDGGVVVVGRDTRRSSAMLHAAVLSGLMSTGCQVVDLGVSPTPTVSFAVRTRGAAGGLVVSGSHNDARWNALKFIGADGALLNAVKSEELLDIYHASAFITCTWDGLRKPIAEPDALDAYVEHVLGALDVAAIRARGFRVAVDFCNGACTAATSRLLDALGCTLLPLNEEPTGEFAHPPAPTLVNMRQLAALMRSLRADIGAAINIDGDRAGFLTADGAPLSEEFTLPLVAQNALFRRPGPVVTNLSTSRMIDDVARRHGQPVIRCYVGEGYTVDCGIAEGATVAGEGSGGVAVLPFTTTFDGMLALATMLEAMARSGHSLAELAARLPRYEMRKGEIPCPASQVSRVMDGFMARLADDDPVYTDGVRVDWPDAWLHVRGSNTEPLVRVIAEADTAERVDALFDDAMAFARRTAFGLQGG